MNYTIISGTDRQGSHTKKAAEFYRELLASRQIDASIFSLDGIDIKAERQSYLLAERKLLVPADRFIILSPEYNGSYPGILKVMIDQSDVAAVWKGKKFC